MIIPVSPTTVSTRLSQRPMGWRPNSRQSVPISISILPFPQTSISRICSKDSLFSYYTLSDGSAINISYREVDANLPDEIKGLNGDVQYVVSQRDYQYAYGSTSDYAMAFSPSYPAATLIPGILADVFDDAAAGEYRVVKYNESDTDP